MWFTGGGNEILSQGPIDTLFVLSKFASFVKNHFGWVTSGCDVVSGIACLL